MDNLGFTNRVLLPSLWLFSDNVRYIFVAKSTLAVDLFWPNIDNLYTVRCHLQWVFSEAEFSVCLALWKAFTLTSR